MNDNDFQEFDSSIRMTEFYEANDDLLKMNAKAVSSNAALLADIAALEAAGANRVSATGQRRDGTVDKTAAKDELYAVVRKIIETAKTIKNDAPDFDNTFKTRRGTLSGQELLETANGFFNDLNPTIAAVFEAFGAANLPTKLTAKINAYEAARTRQNIGRGGGVAATAQTKATMQSLRKNRRTLKTVVANLLEDHADAGLIAEWQSACRIEKKKSAPPTPSQT